MKLRKTLTPPPSSDPSPPDVPPWLKSLPLAPEYRPTLAEFHDPIAYILKIEPEASAFGICKIVPPLPPSPKKLAVSNLNRSLAARHPNPKNPPTFSTRQQQIGLCPRRPRPAQKPVWQSGEQYTLQQFQSKAKQFEQSQLKKTGKKSLSPLETEARFWAAAADKPFTVEYANDVPGSGFAPAAAGAAAGRRWREEEAGSVGETAWNMRRVSRAEGSLLKFMRADIAGVTSPMVYFAMMFSWFAWHAEDHELHSLNYLHFGAGKTWYGVPRDARFAFEEVVRVQGYGGEVNPLVTFSLLGEKTTVMSPEVLVDARIPCCRLVQNAGEFVVTFPGAYHCGFSHGFNCGEAVNIATPEWLRFAKEAAIRRASTNYPPMVSHFQLLYTLALSLSSRLPMSRGTEPRSSRLKDKMKGEGEVMIKKMFVQNVIQNNSLLSALIDTGSSCVVLPKKTSESPINSNPLFRSQSKVTHKLSLGLCSRQEALKASTLLPSDEIMVSRDAGIVHLNGHCSTKGKVTCGTTEQSSSTPDSKKVEGKRESTPQGNGLLDQGLLSCVTCGILSFACVAVVQPREATRRYLMSANCRFLSEQIGDYNNNGTSWKADDYDPDSGSGQKETESPERTYNYLVPCDTNPVKVFDRRVVRGSDTSTQNGMSGLELLASAYGDTSDSEREELPHEMSLCTDENDLDGLRSATAEDSCQLEMGFSGGSHVENPKSTKAGIFENEREMPASISSIKLKDEPVDVTSSELANISHTTGVVITHQTDIRTQNASSCSSDHYPHPFCDSARPTGNVDTTQLRNPDKDSSRMHVFCLEHALEVEKQLHPMGGVRIMLLCHPDYPKIEAEAKQLAEELEIEYAWKDINFREATEEDQERIRAALEDEEAIPTNSDWAVKMGINLYYSASLSKSPLYSKQMPYNAIVYKAFGRDSPNNSPVKPKVSRRKPGKRKKIVVTGKWCGKVWMSNQVHPYLAHGDDCKGVENTGRFLDRAIDQKSKVESDSEDAGLETTPKKNQLLEKRKKVAPPTPAKSVAKKPRLEDSLKGVENGADTPSKSCAMVLRARHDKQIDKLKASDETDKLKAPDETDGGPSTRLRRRPHKPEASEPKPRVKKPTKSPKEAKKAKDEVPAGGYMCDIEGCSMSFTARHELAIHKRDICPVKGCGKKFFAHKYLMQHRKVHVDDRPLECPWKGCEMRFKWPWARTEHLRVHTGDRPYICMEGGCGQTFRFVSDFSRHKRKTGHSMKKERR